MPKNKQQRKVKKVKTRVYMFPGYVLLDRLDKAKIPYGAVWQLFDGLLRLEESPFRKDFKKCMIKVEVTPLSSKTPKKTKR